MSIPTQTGQDFCGAVFASYVQVGTTLDFLPRLSPDRKEVDLMIESKVNQMHQPGP
jgi:hypothetical protein